MSDTIKLSDIRCVCGEPLYWVKRPGAEVRFKPCEKCQRKAQREARRRLWGMLEDSGLVEPGKVTAS